MARKAYNVTFTSVITFDTDEVPEELRTPEMLDIIVETMFFAAQVGDYKVSSLDWFDNDKDTYQHVQFASSICFDDEVDMTITETF
jgi:hypothetical protein